ncbi:MAG: hypothetical protein Q7R47_03340 [Candidatus Diapherotrites archaeon]|nr:hypothetical protein [Candidatus Diapherotrites archaeon]
MPDAKKRILVLGVAHGVTGTWGKSLPSTLRVLDSLIQPGQIVGIERSAKNILNSRSWLRAVGAAASTAVFKRKKVHPTAWEWPLFWRMVIAVAEKKKAAVIPIDTYRDAYSKGKKGIADYSPAEMKVRDQYMVETIRTARPDIVIVGRSHLSMIYAALKKEGFDVRAKNLYRPPPSKFTQKNQARRAYGMTPKPPPKRKTVR